MKAFATQPTFTQPASQPVLRFLGSPEHSWSSASRAAASSRCFRRQASAGTRRRATVTGGPRRPFIVLDGELLIETGDERRVAAAGHVAVLPAIRCTPSWW